MKRFWSLTSVPAALLVALVVAHTASDARETENLWSAGYLSASYAPFAAAPATMPATFSDQTVRQIIRVDAAGRAIRLKLTNEEAIAPLRLASVHVALSDAGGRIVGGTDRAVSFGGSTEAWLATRSPLLSDPVNLPLKSMQHITVSVFFKDKATPAAHHADLVVAPGDQTGAVQMLASTKVRGPGLVSEVDVLRDAAARVIVAFGDSITEGAASTPGADLSWPQQFVRRLAADPKRASWSVVNAGISGNRLLHEGFGPAALARFDRDVLAVAGVTHAVVLEGINDIGWWNQPDSDVTAAQLIDAYRQLVARGHARGVRMIGATLLPYKGAVYFTPEGEVMRQAVNEFIRHGRLFDAVIDFDKVMADAEDREKINPKLEPGDHLHPNDAGYAAMAAAIDPSIFESVN